MDSELLAFVGVFLGCFSRTLLPFLKKLNQYAQSEKPMPWQWRYTWTALVALLLSGMASAVIVPSLEISDGVSLLAMFAVGWTATDVLNTMIS